MDYSPTGSSVHVISQARILEWLSISSSRRSSQPRDQTHISCTAGEFLTTEPPEKPYLFTGVLIINFPYKDASSVGAGTFFVPLLHPPALHGYRHIVGAPEILGE